MAADFRRVLALLQAPENEWNRIVADPAAPRTLRPTQVALLAISTLGATIGYALQRRVGSSVLYVPLAGLLFAAGRVGGSWLSNRLLRARTDSVERADLVAGWGSIPILAAGILEVLPVPLLRWLWALAGLGFVYLNLATAMTPVFGMSKDRAAPLAIRAAAAYAIPVVAFDLLRYVCP
jgi:hypothetical protein